MDKCAFQYGKVASRLIGTDKKGPCHKYKQGLLQVYSFSLSGTKKMFPMRLHLGLPYSLGVKK